MKVHFPERLATMSERIKWLVDNLADGKNTVFAEKLGINEANIRSYIRGVQPKADVLANIVLSYDVNAMWLLTGVGFARQTNDQPEEAPKTLTSNATVKDFFDQFDPYLQRKDAKIVAQAEEIGRLKARIEQLERELEEVREFPPVELDSSVAESVSQTALQST